MAKVEYNPVLMQFKGRINKLIFRLSHSGKPTVYAQPIPPSIPLAAMKLPTVTYHAPQMKNSRNIMAESRTVPPEECDAPGPAASRVVLVISRRY